MRLSDDVIDVVRRDLAISDGYVSFPLLSISKQNEVVRKIFNQVPLSAFITDNTFNHLILVVGPDRVGKSTIVRSLMQEASFFYLVLETELINGHLVECFPEQPHYHQDGSHKNLEGYEFLLELILRIALMMGIPILLDTCRFDRLQWMTRFLLMAREYFPSLRTDVLHITSSKGSVGTRKSEALLRDDVWDNSFNEFQCFRGLLSLTSQARLSISIDNSMDSSLPVVVHPWHITWDALPRVLGIGGPLEIPNRRGHLFELSPDSADNTSTVMASTVLTSNMTFKEEYDATDVMDEDDLWTTQDCNTSYSVGANDFEEIHISNSIDDTQQLAKERQMKSNTNHSPNKQQWHQRRQCKHPNILDLARYAHNRRVLATPLHPQSQCCHDPFNSATPLSTTLLRSDGKESKRGFSADGTGQNVQRCFVCRLDDLPLCPRSPPDPCHI